MATLEKVHLFTMLNNEHQAGKMSFPISKFLLYLTVARRFILLAHCLKLA